MMPEDTNSAGKGSGRCNGPVAHGRQAGPYDVLIVGGGPAGLSAALVLGRCRRRVLVVDSGRPRNASSRAIHGYLSRDGVPPRELLRLGRVELDRYGVEFLEAEVDSARGLSPGETPDSGAEFEIVTRDGRGFRSRKLLLATGIRDVLPPIDGAERYYGRGVHHCPYCDGWEHRDRALVAYGAGRAAVGLALSLRTWSGRVTACTGGKRVAAEDRGRLRRNGIALRTERIARLDGDGEALQRVVFESGPPLECQALFFKTGQAQHSHLPAMLGCESKGDNQMRTDDRQRTCRPGLFLAGDADGDVQFVSVAVAEGARAAVAINRELQDEDRGESRVPPHPAPTRAGSRR
jgi:thioredoxin reductase